MASPLGDLLAGKRPDDVGTGTLAPCSARPNCVSSHATLPPHAIAPLQLGGDPAAAMARLEAVVRTQPGARVVAAAPRYLRAEFVSRVLGFVDDVEFVPDPAAGVIHVRSASRLGYSDFGANRARVEAIRAAFDQAGPPPR
jgi:uncharacterized protein (DUF1499 family)